MSCADLPLATRIAMFSSLFSAEVSTLGMFLVTAKDGDEEDAAGDDVGTSGSSVCSPLEQQNAILERFALLGTPVFEGFRTSSQRPSYLDFGALWHACVTFCWNCTR